jgi:hypothetical protein
MATGGLYGSSPNGVLVAGPNSDTTGLYGDSPNGALVAGPNSDTSGLYGGGVTFGGTYFEWFIFQESATQPATPTGGSWSFVTNTGTPPTGWSLIPPSNPANQVWVSIALVNSRLTSTLTWSTPGLFGVVPNFTFPTPITGAAGSNAAVVNTGTATNPILTFTIPRGNTGATGAQGVPGINWLDTWSSATTYAIRDAVTYNGTSYYAITANTNQAPPNATYWNVLAQKGADGAGGVSSITGTTNQITASSSTGAVTLSLPSTINVNTSGNAATATSATSATSATTATNIAGGAVSQIPYQTGTGATSFIAAPTSSSTYLQWNGSAYTWAVVSGGGGGTVTSVGLSAPSFLSVSGSPITTSGTLALTYSGTALPVANGGTGVTSSSGANSVVLRDTNANITTNCLFEGYVSQAASGTTITLVASSAQNYQITGSGGQVIKLPNATTLPNGALFTFNNNQSSGAITVQNNSSTTVATINSGGYVTIVLLDSSTAAGSWDRHDSTPANVSWSTNTLDYPGSITSSTWNGNAVAINRGGTGQTTAQAAMNTFAGAVTSGSYLRGNGTNVVMSTIQAADVPTLNQNTTGTASNVTGTVAIANGGTGQTTQQAALTALSGTQVSGQYLRSNGTNTLLSAIQAADVPTLNQNTTGTASNVTGTVAIANGGTGQTTASAAFNALSPITSTGDLIIGNGTNSSTRLAIGTNGYVLTSNGTTATWSASTGGVSSITGTASQITASASTGAVTLSLPSTINVNTSGNASTATNVANGAANQIPYQTGSSTTAFITAPTVSSTYLQWNGSAFTWATVSGGGGSPGGSSGQIQYNNSGSFGGITNITVPSGQTAAKVLPRVVTYTSNGATPAINTDLTDVFIITGQSTNITSFTTNLTGTPSNGQKLWISITGTAAVALTFGASFEASGTVPLPTTTQGTVRLDIGFVWNVATSAWRCIASA